MWHFALDSKLEICGEWNDTGTKAQEDVLEIQVWNLPGGNRDSLGNG